MTPETDADLLRQFAEHQSDGAFAALVARYVNLVYSVALRQTRDPHQAEEIAQMVFIIFARKAGTLRSEQALSNWLFQTTRLTANNFLRSELRRHGREQEAYMQSTLDESVKASWPLIEPLLDNAVEALGETDRRAILLRFYEGRTLSEVGTVLGATEGAAKKRVERALEKLRKYFSKRGVALSAGTIAAVVAANSVQAGPAGLAAAISAASLAGTAGAAATIIAETTRNIAMTTFQKIAVTATLAVTIGAGIHEAQEARDARAEAQTLRQQQAPLAEQSLAFQNERDNATNRLAALLAENSRLRSTEPELLKLRGEVALPRNGRAEVLRHQTDDEPKDDSPGATNTYIATAPLSQRINRLQAYLSDHPEAGIPEIQFASPVKWLNSIQGPIGTDDQLGNALTLLRRQAMSGFLSEIRSAELDFEKANNGNFPTALEQLLPFLDSAKGRVMLDNYEIVPARTITDPNAHITGDWVITRKTRVNPGSNPSEERLAAYAGGQSVWYASDARD